MIGCGSMGGGMAQLFAEHGMHVSIKDPSEKAMDTVLASAGEAGIADRITKYQGERANFLYAKNTTC